MYFDARAAKLLKPGNHIVVDGCTGLRLIASETRRTWAYRYKDPATDLMKQIKIGSWPAMPVAEAAAQWQVLRARRDNGEDLTATKRKAKFAIKIGPELGYMALNCFRWGQIWMQKWGQLEVKINTSNPSIM
jgi:Arm DNA-binding domain